ncbi:MAG TPA: hypothetical protein VFA84_15545 [Acidimicrobiales bacterium]|nr:hypothetical protein [Acidimicrobiales bacterium]
MSERPGAEARITHADDLEPQQVRAQRHPDGSERSVWDRYFVISREPGFVSMFTSWDAGVLVHRHGHMGHHVMYVLRGGMHCGDEWCGPGTHIEVPLGAAAGPFVAGPDGADIFEVTAGEGHSWEADPDGFAALLAERGVTPLPNPPITLPDWMEDRRSDQSRLVRNASSDGAAPAGARGGGQR